MSDTLTDAQHDWASKFCGVDTRNPDADAQDDATQPAAVSQNVDPSASGLTTDLNASNQSAAPNAGGQTTDPIAAGQTTDPNASNQSAAPNAGGQTTDPNAAGQTTDPNASNQSPAPNAGGQTTDPNAAGQTTDPNSAASAGGLLPALWYSISGDELSRLKSDLAATSGSVQDAIQSEYAIQAAGQSYGIDPTDRAAVTQWMQNASDMAVQDPQKADKINRARNYRTRMEDITRSIHGLTIQIVATKDHIAALDEMKKAFEKRPTDDPGVGKGFEWFYDFTNCAAQALLDWDPAKLTQSLFKMVSDIAGADVIKDNVQKLADNLKEVQSALDKTIKNLGAFQSAEASTYSKQLSATKTELASEQAALLDASENYHAALTEVFKESDSDGIAQQLTESVRKAIETSLSELNSATASMKDSPLRDSKYQSAMIPLGDFAFETDAAVTYNQGNRTNAFGKGSGVGRSDVELIAAGLPGAIKALSDLDATLARVRDLSTLWNDAARKAFGW